MSTKYFAPGQSPSASFGWTLQQVLLLNFNARRSSNGKEEHCSQDESDDMSIKYFAPGQTANASFGWTIQQLLLHKYTERRASCGNDEKRSGYGTGQRVTDMRPSPLSSDNPKAIATSPEIAECMKCPSPLRCTMKHLISAPNPSSTKCLSCSPASSVTNKLNISASIPGCTECIRCPQHSNDFTIDLLNSVTNAGCTKCMRCLSSTRDNMKPQNDAQNMMPYCTHCTTDNYLPIDDKSSSLNLDEGTECDSLISDEGYETVDKELDSGHFDTSLPVLCPRLMNLLGPISPDGRLYLETMIDSSTESLSTRSGRRKRRKGRCDRLRYIHSIETDSSLQKELEEPRSVFFGTVNRLTLQLRDITNDATSMHTDLQQLKHDYQELDVGIGDVLEEAKQLKSELEALSYLDDLIWLLRGRLDLISPKRWPFLTAQESFSTNLVI